MIRIIFLFIIATAASAHSALVDDQGRILDVAITAGSAKAGASWTDIPKYDAGLCDTLYDEYGRCRWRVDAGAFVKISTPEFPAKAAPEETQKKQALGVARLERALQRVILLERWQATPGLVAVQDRQAELDAAAADVTKIGDVLSGK